MKYTISEKKLFETIKKFYEDTVGKPFPEIKKKRRVSFRGNSGYGSSMQEYVGINVMYFDDEGNVLFYEFSDRDHLADHKWTVNEIFLPIYDFFGDETFENFIKSIYGFDLKNKGGKQNDWYFDNLEHEKNEINNY